MFGNLSNQSSRLGAYCGPGSGGQSEAPLASPAKLGRLTGKTDLSDVYSPQKCVSEFSGWGNNAKVLLVLLCGTGTEN